MSARFDDLIAIASNFKQLTEELLEAYRGLSKVIELEHDAIKTGKISAVEQVGQDKEFATNLVMELVGQLQLAGDGLARKYNEITGKVVDMDRSLSGYSELLNCFNKELQGDSGFAGQIFVHVADGVALNVSSLLEWHRIMKPKIEMNKFLTETLLSQHQQNYQFWQEIAAEAESVYTKKGKRRSENGGGILKVRA